MEVKGLLEEKMKKLKIKEDREIIMSMLMEDPRLIEYVILPDKEMCLIVLKEDPFLISRMEIEKGLCRELALSALKIFYEKKEKYMKESPFTYDDGMVAIIISKFMSKLSFYEMREIIKEGIKLGDPFIKQMEYEVDMEKRYLQEQEIKM